MDIAYHGYLAPYVGLIRDLHGRGASTRAIAEALYAAGARAQASGGRGHQLSRANHITNLQAMTIYVQRRLGLRVRRFRVLNLKVANEMKLPAGGRLRASKSLDADGSTMPKEKHHAETP